MNDTALLTRPDSEKPPAPRRGRGWAVTGLVVMLVAALCGAFTVYAYARTSSRTEQATAAGPVTALEVVGNSTDVRVRPVAGGAPAAVTARLTDRAGEASWSHRLRDGRLEVTGECAQRLIANFCSVQLTVDVPAGTPVTIRSSTGDLQVEGMRDVHATTSTGDVTLRSVTGPLTATASTGEITASDLDVPDARVTTSTGDIWLEHRVPPRRVTAEASTGDITISLPPDGTAYRVDGTADTGDVVTDVPQDSRSGRLIRAETGTGDVLVR